MPRARDTRTDILRAAAKLFDREGFHAVSMDDISAAAGVAKMTVYRHFATKDTLIVACLERSNAKFDSWVVETMGEGLPARRIERLYEGLDHLDASLSYAGCSFQRVFLELDEAHPARAVASQYAHSLVVRLSGVCEEGGIAHPGAVGSGLYLILTGAFVASRQAVPGDPARCSSLAAKALLGGS